MCSAQPIQSTSNDKAFRPLLTKVLRNKLQAGNELRPRLAGRSGISGTEETRALDDPWMEDGFGISPVQKEQLASEYEMGKFLNCSI
ncbi:uncharacterized protein LOC115695957 [Cannabis sativa]|uniref:uncharacterized protein LOC115695957 n=1 Tax=Cannabis sativa TaxID=3483 RepID=UPI0029CA4987|nr:uncharacterized protein LOC115695957 [Cannabis sativa]